MRRALVILSTVALAGFSTAGRADFRSDLAKQFNADPKYFVLNLPPRPGGWPGSIYTSDLRFSLVQASENDHGINGGPPFDLAATITLDVGGQSGLSLGRIFGLSSGASNVAIVAVTFKQTRIFDLTLGELRTRLSKLREQDRRSPGPVIVYRTYVGIPALSLNRRTDVSAEAWATLKKGLVEAGFSAAATAGDSLAVQSTNRLIFGFEIARAVDVGLVINAALPERNCIKLPSGVLSCETWGNSDSTAVSSIIYSAAARRFGIEPVQAPIFDGFLIYHVPP